MKLQPDSPQLSEWLDGRLTADEAAVVAAAVRSDPQLADVVSDLRQVRQLLMEAGDAVVPAAPLADSVMAAIAGGMPGDEDPLSHVGQSSPRGGKQDEADEDESDQLVDDHVEEEWDRLERRRIEEERVEAREDVETLLAARAGRGGADGLARRWLAPVLGGALAAGLLVAVVLNLPQPGPPGDLAGSGDDEPPGPLLTDVPEIDAAALAARMIARGIELTEGKQSLGVLRMTVRLGDREGRRQFEELLARSDVRLDRGEVGEDGRSERIGCLGRADEVDRLLESLAVSGGSFSVASGSLSRDATDRLERRGPVTEPVLAAADALPQTAAAEAAAPEATVSDMAVPEVAAVQAAAEPQALVMAAPPQQFSPKARGAGPVADASHEPAADLMAAAPAAAAAAPGSAEGAATAGESPPQAAAAVARAMDAPADEPPQGPPAWLIPPEGYVRLWIDIIDDTQPDQSR